jgi:uncharacterized protein (UPF0548 family)
MVSSLSQPLSIVAFFVELTHSLWAPPLRIGRPSADTIESDLLRAAGSPSTVYNGCTFGEQVRLPHGWYVGRSDSVIGRGDATYARAAKALQHLHFFEHSWLTVRCSKAKAGDAELMAVCSRQLGCLWLTNVNRMLNRVEGERSSSVSWATTQRHVLAGEETIRVTHDTSTDLVHFSILSFSRPRHLFSFAAYPYVVLQQQRFARDATAAMQRATQTPEAPL